MKYREGVQTFNKNGLEIAVVNGTFYDRILEGVHETETGILLGLTDIVIDDKPAVTTYIEVQV